MAIGEPARRRRRSPGEARREIIAAAETLLRERPFRELTVDEVMRQTDLSRPSFYVYFRDRHQLVLAVVHHLEGALLETAAVWSEGTGDGRALLRKALAGVVDVYEGHGPVLCALADAASDDPEVERVYGRMVQTFVDAAARKIEAEIEAGAIVGLEAGPIAAALTYAGERYLGVALGKEPFDPPEQVREAITAIWTRTLYGPR